MCTAGPRLHRFSIGQSLFLQIFNRCSCCCLSSVPKFTFRCPFVTQHDELKWNCECHTYRQSRWNHAQPRQLFVVGTILLKVPSQESASEMFKSSVTVGIAYHGHLLAPETPLKDGPKPTMGLQLPPMGLKLPLACWSQWDLNYLCKGSSSVRMSIPLPVALLGSIQPWLRRHPRWETFCLVSSST